MNVTNRAYIRLIKVGTSGEFLFKLEDGNRFFEQIEYDDKDFIEWSDVWSKSGLILDLCKVLKWFQLER